MNLLIESVHSRWLGRNDHFVGGNMFIYYSVEQARNRDYCGPDFLLVKDVDARRDRRYWALWEEEGRYPDVMVELISPSTRKLDLETKKHHYERTFKTSEYFCYSPDEDRLWE